MFLYLLYSYYLLPIINANWTGRAAKDRYLVLRSVTHQLIRWCLVSSMLGLLKLFEVVGYNNFKAL